jgi:hypothetical protein
VRRASLLLFMSVHAATFFTFVSVIFAFLSFLTLDIKHNSFQKGISIFEIHNMNPATYGGQVTKLKNNIVIKY